MQHTYVFSVEVDAPGGWKVQSLARAIHRAIEYARENDISGAEMLDHEATRLVVRVSGAPVISTPAAQQMLEAILDELERLGIGDDEHVNGADAVDYLNALMQDLQKFLKVKPPPVACPSRSENATPVTQKVSMKENSLAAVLEGLIEFAEKYAADNGEPDDGACAEAVRAGRNAVLTTVREPIHIVVGVEGGLVQGASADRTNVHVTVVDYDTDDADKANLTAVPQDDKGNTSDAYVSSFSATHDPKWVRQVLDRDNVIEGVQGRSGEVVATDASRATPNSDP